MISLRECPMPESMIRMRRARDAVAYWRRHIARAAWFNPDCECTAVILLNSRRRMTGHHIVSVGGLTEAMAGPREVFRAAVIAGAHSVLLMHNHPSGEPEPSGGDLITTGILRRAAVILGIPLLDHVIVGRGKHFSFLEQGRL